MPKPELTKPNWAQEPNWERILHSEIWQEEIVPFVQGMLDATLIGMAEHANYHDFQRYQGGVLALKDVLETPQARVNAEQMRKAQQAKAGYSPEEIEATNGRRTGNPSFLGRWSRKLGISSGRAF